jgi:UDP-glucose 4-epimerase
MRILVTGGAGFIASNIADAYISEGHQVVVVDNLSSGRKANLNPKVEFYKADITDTKKINRLFEKHKFDVVNHLAAQIDVRKSVADPVFDAQVNVIGTLNILENCQKNEVGKMIFSSSGGVIYGECQEGTNPDETSLARPMSPYGVTKLTIEYYLKYYQATYSLKYSVLRYGNVYGPRQDPFGEAGVVAIFCQGMLNNKDLFIFGDGEQVRDYVYVKDVVRANVLALTKGDNEIFNIGTGIATSVNTLFAELKGINNYQKTAIYKPARTGELARSCLGIAKAKDKLGWVPENNIKDGLKKTSDWFREYLKI